ncbi:hypothetical protein Tco_0159950, partial [Tanacetum coccineum]
YTRLDIPEFRDTLIQNMDYVKKSIGTESKEQDTSSRSGNDAHVDDADIKPIYDEEPSWSTSFKTRRTSKTSSALEALWKTLFMLYLYKIGTL